MEITTRSTSLNILIKFWFVVLASLAACLVGILLFRHGYTESYGTYRRLTTVADADSDGDLDVILVGTRWEGASTSFAGAMVWYNQGEGKFSLGEQRFGGFSTGTGDVDKDGDPDLLVQNGMLDLYLNQGGAQGGQAGFFEIHNPIRPKLKLEGHNDMGGSVSLGDLDRDGDVDGFVTNCCYGESDGGPDHDFLSPSFSWVWLNEWDPRGWLVRHSLLVPALDGLPVPASALGDLDNDGDLDAFVVVSQPRAGKAGSLADQVLLNDGTGGFTDSGQRLGESDSTSVALGDVDADGDLDALVGAREGATLWTNQGGAQAGAVGSFEGYAQNFARISARLVFLHDLDNDGDLDALFAWQNLAEIWHNNGAGVFTPAGQTFPLSRRRGLVVGDFNADGWADIFSAEETGYQLWLNDHGSFVLHED